MSIPEGGSSRETGENNMGSGCRARIQIFQMVPKAAFLPGGFFVLLCDGDSLKIKCMGVNEVPLIKLNYVWMQG